MKIIILGPQGSGKGTQAELLAKDLGLTRITMGERLRQEVASGSRLGQMIKELIDKGEMVPDELVQKMIQHHIEASRGKFILDGFPRNASQANWLDNIINIDKVILLDVKDKTSIERLTSRRECAKGHTYNLMTNPPKKKDFCDEDGLPLKKRDDDVTIAIIRRLETYHSQTKPLLQHYKDKLLHVDGEQNIPSVYRNILKLLHAKPE